jgi:CheY-like chemotaxis protein
MVAFPYFMSPDCLADLKIVVVEDHDDARRYLDLFLGQLGASRIGGPWIIERVQERTNGMPR